MDHQILWVDFSIPGDQRLELFDNIPEACRQEFYLQERHLNRLRLELEQFKSLSASRDIIDKLQAEMRWCSETMFQLRHLWDEYVLEGIEHYRDRPIALYDLGKIGKKTVKESPNLSLGIRDRILEADLVIIISGAYDQHREWMQFECYTAVDHQKPIIAIIPPGQKGNPIEMKHFANWIIDWNFETIKETIEKAKAEIMKQRSENRGFR